MTALPVAGARRAEPRAIDWRLAAELIARGLSLAAVARRVGCSRARLSRRRHHDPGFRRSIEELEEIAAERDRNRIVDLRLALHTAIETEVGKGNVRVIIWLADRLKLITPPSERTPQQELQAIVRSLSPDELREFESLRNAP
jgi:transcriptional regulator with XRE-family HTH domain